VPGLGAGRWAPNAPNSARPRPRRKKFRAQTTRHCVVRACKNYAMSGAALARRLSYVEQRNTGARFGKWMEVKRGVREMPVQELERHTRLTRAGIGHPCPDQLGEKRMVFGCCYPATRLSLTVRLVTIRQGLPGPDCVMMPWRLLIFLERPSPCRVRQILRTLASNC